jgi:type IV pilus biogenesis protein CpaD/CtpE
MAPRMRRVLALVLAASLAACGSREALRPISADRAPAKPALAARAPTTEEMLKPAPITRPLRQDEGLQKSEPRKDDPFDLPPTR